MQWLTSSKYLSEHIPIFAGRLAKGEQTVFGHFTRFLVVILSRPVSDLHSGGYHKHF